MAEPKKRTRRSSLKYPALSPQHALRSRFEETEDLASYANTLSDEDKDWLNRFAEEEIHCNLKHSGEKLNDVSDPAVRSRIYSRNNQRNRCILTRETAKGSIQFLEDLDIDNIESADNEDSYE